MSVPAVTSCPVRTWPARSIAFAIRSWQEDQAVAVHDQRSDLNRHVHEPTVQFDPAEVVVRSITPQTNGYTCRAIMESSSKIRLLVACLRSCFRSPRSGRTSREAAVAPRAHEP